MSGVLVISSAPTSNKKHPLNQCNGFFAFWGLKHQTFNTQIGRAKWHLTPKNIDYNYSVLISRAGLPATTVFSFTFLVTSDPAPITLLSPIDTPAKIIAPAPIHTLLPIIIGAAKFSLFSRSVGLTAWDTASNWTLGPIKQSSPMVIAPSLIGASNTVQLMFMKLRSPIVIWLP